MKRFKLIRELPTFHVGDEFILDSDGCLYLAETCHPNSHWKSKVMAYHKNTLEKFPNILEDWFVEIEPTKIERVREMLEELKNEIDEYLEEEW